MALNFIGELVSGSGKSDTMSNGARAKRNRSGNWLHQDKMLLKKIAKDLTDILDNKNTDNETNVKKREAWLQVTESFNAMCKGDRRTPDQLKGQWKIVRSGPIKEKKCIEVSFEPNDSDDQSSQLSNVQVHKNTLTVGPMQQIHSRNTSAISENNPAKRQRYNFTSSDFANKKLTEIAEHEIKLKNELHQMKMMNERKKAEILEAKHQLIKAKLDYFKNQYKDQNKSLIEENESIMDQNES